jgi:hypothetical protein
MGGILALLGMIVAAVGGIWFLVVAFKESILWGLGCLLIPIVWLVFLIKFWQDAKNPFLLNLCGYALILMGGAMSGA